MNTFFFIKKKKKSFLNAKFNLKLLCKIYSCYAVMVKVSKQINKFCWSRL